jgi:dTDP-4-dehydrorhamnose reductase
MADARKIFIIGASGLVGGYLLDYFGQRAVGTGNANTASRQGLIDCDITDAAQTNAVVAQSGADVIVHTAAYTHVDGCEQNPELSKAVNVEGTRNVAEACQKAGLRYIFVSTDYVFGGDSGPHKIGESFAPINVYGQHKVAAEQIVSNTVENHAIVRSCNLYGWQPGGKNFVMAVYQLGLEGKPMRVPVDQFGSPTLADDMASAVDQLASSDQTGAFHFAGPDYVDRLEWAQRSAEAFKIDPGFVTGVVTSEMAQPATRPLKGGLDASETCSRLGVSFRGVDGGLAAMREAMQRDGIRFAAA